MQIRPITKSFHVSGQLAPTDIPQLAASGYSMVICMRPDGEGWGQPDFSVIEDAAKAAGLKSYYLPVVPGSVSGARCAGLYQMSQQIG